MLNLGVKSNPYIASSSIQGNTRSTGYHASVTVRLTYKQYLIDIQFRIYMILSVARDSCIYDPKQS